MSFTVQECKSLGLLAVIKKVIIKTSKHFQPRHMQHTTKTKISVEEAYHYRQDTLGTRGFSRVRWEFSVLAEGRHIFGRSR